MQGEAISGLYKADPKQLLLFFLPLNEKKRQLSGSQEAPRSWVVQPAELWDSEAVVCESFSLRHYSNLNNVGCSFLRSIFYKCQLDQIDYNTIQVNCSLIFWFLDL